jgi:predicted extracellular nuclease
MALAQGDIAFTSFNADEDGWSIVPFVNIEPNTVIYFTDNEATSLTAFNTGESYFQWNSGSSPIAAGTVIRFSAIDAATRSASVGLFSQVTVTGSSNVGLSATADTVYAYLGASATSPTVFLAGVSNDTNAQGTTDLTAAGLTIGTNAILLNSSADYGVYNGSRNGQASFANYRALVNDVSNWTVDITNGVYDTTVPNTANFAIASGTPTVDLSVSATTGTEAGTTVITVAATASSAVAGNQTVGLTVTGNGITASDYTLSNSILTIPNDATTGSATFTVVDDVLVEGTETATLTLSNPSSGIALGNATQNIVITDNDIAASTRIRDIQGSSHISSLNGQSVTDVPGIVTALAPRGFYLQDPNPDANDATSEAIFVFTSSAPTVQVGDSVQVGGTVSEFRPANSATNLTTTEITNPIITKLSGGNALPAAVILGNGGRTIPPSIIENDAANVETSGIFDPAQDGIDFYESLEGMRVQINNPVATSPTNSFGEFWVLADNGSNATGRTARGGSLISASDFNPERIQIDDTLLNPSSGGYVSPNVSVGAQLSTVVGVVDYSFGNYEVLPTSVPTVLTPSTLSKEVTPLAATPSQLTVATFNVANLDVGDGTTQFNTLADRIVNNLKSPDIIVVEEIQDNNGPTNDSVVDASVTYQTLINAIAAAGGPTYEYRQINPVDDQDGGEPGGNIRQGFLYNPNRTQFTDRPGGGSLVNTTVTNVGGVPQLSASPGRIDPTNTAFSSSRKPLVGEFTFNGQTVFVVGNHFNSKGGDQPLFGPNQPPALSSETQRNQQATLVATFTQNILAIDPKANVIVAGDLNDFEFSNPLNILKGSGLTPLIETLPQNERYTYNFQGNAQTLDHITASSNLLNRLEGYDVVHINSEFFDQVSDHDPSVASFNLRKAPLKNDFNGDGKTDIVVRNQSTGENAFALMDDAVVTQFTFSTPVTDPNWTIDGAGDFDKDGKPDVVLRNQATGENAIALMDGTALRQIVFTSILPDPNWGIGGVGDFNNDGNLDLVYRNKATGANSFALMNGTNLSQIVSTEILPNLNWEIGGAGDFNNDGKDDVLFRNKATGENSFALMNGTNLGQLVSTQILPDLNWTIGSVGDYNRDGKADILYRNQTTGENSFALMNGTNLSQVLPTLTVADTNWRIGA